MSLRSWCLVLALGCMGAACGGEGKDADEPQTAREKMRREAKRDKNKDEDVDPAGKSWGKWRYTGDRDECYFRLGRKCFKTEAAACSKLRCKKPTKCHAEGAAPAQVSCK